jgi:nitrogen regulatory protein PII
MELHMKLVTAIFRPEKLTAVQAALGEIGIAQATFTDVWGTGNERSQVVLYRGTIREVRLPRVKIEIVVDDESVDAVVDAVALHGKTGQVGDGVILVVPIESFVRIRTGACLVGTDRRTESTVHVPTNRLQGTKALAALR